MCTLGDISGHDLSGLLVHNIVTLWVFTALTTTEVAFVHVDNTCCPYCFWWTTSGFLISVICALIRHWRLVCKVNWRCGHICASVREFLSVYQTVHVCSIRFEQIMMHIVTYDRLTTFWSGFQSHCLHPVDFNIWIRFLLRHISPNNGTS